MWQHLTPHPLLKKNHLNITIKEGSLNSHVMALMSPVASLTVHDPPDDHSAKYISTTIWALKIYSFTADEAIWTCRAFVPPQVLV